MKKIALFAMLAALSGSAISGTITPSTSGQSADVSLTDCPFLQTAITGMKVSANVGMSYICSTTAAAVMAGSTKGKYTYGGSTSGGGVARCTTNGDVSTTTGYSTTISSADGNGCS